MKENRRTFVRKSLITSLSVSSSTLFAGLIRAQGQNEGSPTTQETTIETTVSPGVEVSPKGYHEYILPGGHVGSWSGASTEYRAKVTIQSSPGVGEDPVEVKETLKVVWWENGSNTTHTSSESFELTGALSPSGIFSASTSPADPLDDEVISVPITTHYTSPVNIINGHMRYRYRIFVELKVVDDESGTNVRYLHCSIQICEREQMQVSENGGAWVDVEEELNHDSEPVEFSVLTRKK